MRDFALVHPQKTNNNVKTRHSQLLKLFAAKLKHQPLSLISINI
jgi:hypothetical protein